MTPIDKAIAALEKMIKYYDPGIPREPGHVHNEAREALIELQKLRGRG